MEKTTVLLADDHKIVRMGLSALFASDRNFSVIAEADNGKSTVEKTLSAKPDVIIMDLMMPGVDGIEATREIKSRLPNSKIVILTSYSTSDKISQALALGADGALLKTTDDTNLLNAVRKVSHGERYLSPDIQKLMANDPPAPPLTIRQLEVLQSIARGLTNADIAKLLAISEQRVDQHIKVIFTKLGAANRAEAIGIALRKHLLKI